MKYTRGIAITLLVLAVVSDSGASQVVQKREALSAPTYYLAVQVVSCDGRAIRVNGASNLPPGSVVTLVVADFVNDGWRGVSDDAYVRIDKEGFFRAELVSGKSSEFHHNSVVRAYFAPYRPNQPGEVLARVGRKGQNLGGLSNPQVFQVSGWNYGLETIARVPNCGERVGDTQGGH